MVDNNFMDHTNCDICLIPRPAVLQRGAGYFLLNKDVRLSIDGDHHRLRQIELYLRQHVEQHTGICVPSGPEIANAGRITLVLKHELESLDEEAYRLSVKEQEIIISAAAEPGLFYGIQTLLQLLPFDRQASGEITVPAVEIEDHPRFGWRGMHLDTARHFFPIKFIKKYIDLLALYKMNVFHWHLTDDQGWRVEIKRYPKLTEIGAWRPGADGRRYGGFYSQEEIREVVDYARARQVSIVPEIELPGHCRAALAAYPKYSCTGGPFTVTADWGIFADVFCPGREETFEFLQDVLAEVIDLFPSGYVHLGGDECPRDRWVVHDLCQARMRAENLGDADELQAYFIRRINRFIAAQKRKLVGWDEILDGGPPAGATIMAWRDEAAGARAARAGFDVVMTPRAHCYFDYYQSKTDEPRAIGGYLPLEQVYSFEPVPAELDPAGVKHILGGQGNVWTEYMPTQSHVEYMALPRMCAMAEVLWSPQKLRDLEDFQQRLAGHFPRLRRKKVNFRPPE